MSSRILVVDRNEAFATMLKEMLETDGGYVVEAAHSGSEALAHLREMDFELTIVDMDLDAEDMAYGDLVQNVREIRPRMRVMLIPLMGEALPSEVQDLDIQGTLSKPFFADDLLPNIREALTKPIGAPGVRASTPVPGPQDEALLPVEQILIEVQAALSDLARETNADAAVLVSTEAAGQGIVAHAGMLGRADMETLAQLSVTTIQAAQATAQALGQPDAPFEHNMFEGEALRLYIMVLSEDLLLIVVAPISTPLGTIRYNLRRIRRDLVRLALT